MSQIAETTLFENLKEKLANPFLFTYFWVFIAYHYSELLFLFFEPLTMSKKLYKLEGNWAFKDVLFYTCLALLITPILNTVVEFYKQTWDKWLDWLLDKSKVKAMVTHKQYEELVRVNTELVKRERLATTEYDAIKKDRQVSHDNSVKLQSKLEQCESELHEVKNSHKKDQGLIERLEKRIIELEQEVESRSATNNMIRVSDEIAKAIQQNYFLDGERFDEEWTKEKEFVDNLSNQTRGLIKLAATKELPFTAYKRDGSFVLGIDDSFHNVNVHRDIITFEQEIKDAERYGIVRQTSNGDYELTLEGYRLFDLVKEKPSATP